MVSTIKKNLIKSRIASVARVVMALSFASLVFVGVSHLVRAFSVETVNQSGGIPSDWGITSANHPDEITVPISYWDQDYDCKTFEFWNTNILRKCGLQSSPGGGGLAQGIVEDTLDSEGLPVPTYATHSDAKAAGVDIQSQYITKDNFNHWFHETSKSTKYDREITFKKQGDKNSYVYGGKQIFPLDGVKTAQTIDGHNFHFTAHLQVPIKTNLSGEEVFDFTGDDDVWVFLNNQLVLDIGGCHSAIDGTFTINSDGSVTSTVEGKHKKTIDLGLEKGQVVNLDFFYAERSTSESNTKITISDMEWPISSESKLKSEIIDGKLIKYTSYLRNSDPSQTIDLIKVASYIKDADGNQKSGFIPLSAHNLEYTTTPKVDDSWKPLAVKAPGNGGDGFKLENPIRLAAAGDAGDTVYLRYFVKPEENEINYTNTIAYYTANAHGDYGITYDYATDATDELEVKPRYVNVNFDSRGGSEIDPQNIIKNTVATRPDDPEKDGYTFVGWTFAGTDYDFNSPVEKDITLVARWELIPKEKYLVSYDSNGGSAVDSEQVEEGAKATEPKIPTRNGYKFIGWSLDGEDYDFNSPVNDNITLFANWEKVVFTVNFDSRGGSAVDPQAVNKGDTATHPEDPILKNYELVDWVDDEGNSYNFATIVTQDITLHAVWEKNVFTVSFNSNGGSSVDAQKVERDHTATEPEIPTLEGYTFLGWTLGGTGYLFSTPVTSDITLIAHWEKTSEEQPITPDPDEPETPSEPETPEQPETPMTEPGQEPTPAPVTPIDPTLPTDEVIIDLTDPEDAPEAVAVLGAEEDTMFLPVLGEVAYVPDTGLVTNILSDPFGSKTFAAIVLSQGYILVNLAVFALSFYLYLSYRKYLPAGGKALLPSGEEKEDAK